MESLSHYKNEFEDTDNITLQALLNDCHKKIGLICCKFHSTIYVTETCMHATPKNFMVLSMFYMYVGAEEKEVQESYEALKRAFSRTDQSDNKDILKLLFNVKDEQNMPLYHGETKEEV